MNRSGTHDTNIGKAKIADHIRKSRINSGEQDSKPGNHTHPADAKDHKPGNRESIFDPSRTQSAPHQTRHTGGTGTSIEDDLAFHGRRATPGVEGIKGKWKQVVGAAKIAWEKLTEDELLKSEGQHQKLAGLIQERYSITQDEANNQVKSFMEKHQS